MGPQRSNPTSDDGHFPRPKDQHEHDQDDEEFWHAQIRHKSQLHFKRARARKFRLSLDTRYVGNDDVLDGLSPGRQTHTLQHLNLAVRFFKLLSIRQIRRQGYQLSLDCYILLSFNNMFRPLSKIRAISLSDHTNSEALSSCIWIRRSEHKLCFDGYITGYFDGHFKRLVVTVHNREFVIAFGHAYPCQSTIVGAVPVWSTI